MGSARRSWGDTPSHVGAKPVKKRKKEKFNGTFLNTRMFANHSIKGNLWNWVIQGIITKPEKDIDLNVQLIALRLFVSQVNPGRGHFGLPLTHEKPT